tara:strand:- start:2175 stop:2804 length:630 start_codon:yes stop_codon:yes gene_type:complete
MSKQLLIEHAMFIPTKRINEGVKSAVGNMIVSGLVQACDKPNANHRIYPYTILHTQVEKYMQGPIAENRALGELDHPESSVVNLKNVSHNITKLWWQGKELYGDIEILPTPSGNILKQLFQNNITVGISSRALGSVSPIGEGLVQVEDDLDLICWDFVSQPSTYGAYMRPTSGLNESINRTINKENKYSKANRMISEIICNVSGECCIR